MPAATRRRSPRRDRTATTSLGSKDRIASARARSGARISRVPRRRRCQARACRSSAEARARTPLPARTVTRARTLAHARAAPLRAQTEALVAWTRAHGLTLSTVVQGAWALLLARTSGRRDVLYGVTCSGRPAELAGVEAMVGLFINTLPVRVFVDERRPLRDWLADMQRRAAALVPFEWTPITDIAACSGIDGGRPLFESLFVFENYPLDGFDAASAAARYGVRAVHVEDRTNYPLNLIATPGAELSLVIACDEDRIERGTAESLLAGLARLLANFVERPASTLSEFDPLGADDRRTLERWRAGRDRQRRRRRSAISSASRPRARRTRSRSIYR